MTILVDGDERVADQASSGEVGKPPCPPQSLAQLAGGWLGCFVSVGSAESYPARRGELHGHGRPLRQAKGMTPDCGRVGSGSDARWMCHLTRQADA